MGLLRDAIGSALGANQINNGLSERPRLAFGNNYNSGDGRRPLPPPRKPSSSSNQRYSDYANPQERQRRSPDEKDFTNQRPDRNDSPYRTEQYSDRRYQSSMNSYPPDNMQQMRDGYDYQSSQPPPGYEAYNGDGRGGYQRQAYDRQPPTDLNYAQDRQYSQAADFRPLALPQIGYGEGQPFLRGYSRELSRYNISMEDFIQVLDTINVAIIPSPENQIFQKGANIAGFFLPGAAGIGLTVGQIGIGLGAAAGHSSQVASALSNANMNLFLPNGLELCIGTSKDVDAEVGISPGAARPDSITVSPRERQAYYGELIASLSQVLPPLQQSGRNDPIAQFGRGMSSRDSQKKVAKAQRRLEKGKTKAIDNLEGSLKWIIVRRASADALAYLKKNRR